MFLLLLPLFQQLNNGLFHTLWCVAGWKVFAKRVALEGDALRFFFLLGHDGSHDLGGQLAALGELLQSLRLRQRRCSLLAVHSIEKKALLVMLQKRKLICRVERDLALVHHVH